MLENRSLQPLFKKVIVVFLALVLVYSIGCSTVTKDNNKAPLLNGEEANTEEATDVIVSTLQDNDVSGKQMVIQIAVKPNTDIAGIQFDLSFNPSVARASSIEEGDMLSKNGANTYFNPGIIDNNAGTIKGIYGVIIGSGQGVSTEGVFATIILILEEKEAVCPISLSNVIVGDVEANSLPVHVLIN